MNKIFLCIVVFITTSTFAQETNLDWFTDFETAQNVSKKHKKPILMYFTGSDWCVPCIMLKEDFFSTEKFKKQSQDLVLLKVDIPRRTDIISEKQLKANKKLLEKYNKQASFPQVIALKESGKVIGSEGSYSASLRDPNRYFTFVTTIIENY